MARASPRISRSWNAARHLIYSWRPVSPTVGSAWIGTALGFGCLQTPGIAVKLETIASCGADTGWLIACVPNLLGQEPRWGAECTSCRSCPHHNGHLCWLLTRGGKWTSSFVILQTFRYSALVLYWYLWCGGFFLLLFASAHESEKARQRGCYLNIALQFFVWLGFQYHFLAIRRRWETHPSI